MVHVVYDCSCMLTGCRHADIECGVWSVLGADLGPSESCNELY